MDLSAKEFTDRYLTSFLSMKNGSVPEADVEPLRPGTTTVQDWTGEKCGVDVWLLLVLLLGAVWLMRACLGRHVRRQVHHPGEEPGLLR